jgi:hypothetical protein
MALDAVLVGVGPGVAAHPLSLALGTFKFTETPLPALVRRLSFAFRSSLGTIFDVVALLEAQVAHVGRRRPLEGPLVQS